MGAYAQDIGGLLSQRIDSISPFRSLFIVTLSSWVLYITTPVLAYIFKKNDTLQKKSFFVYVILTIIVGGLVSLWSLFVLAMSG